MARVNILFVTPCNPHIPSGVARVRRYFPHLERLGIGFRQMDYMSPTAQKIQRWMYVGRMDGSRVASFVIRNVIHAFSVSHRLARRRSICKLARHYDAVFLQRVLLPPATLRVLKSRNPNLVYDFDDSVFATSPAAAELAMRAAWKVVAGSRFLLDHAKEVNPDSVLVPTPIPVGRFLEPAGPPIMRHPATVGWIGSYFTLGYLKRLAAPLRAMACAGIRFRLLVAGTWGRLSDALPELGDLDVVQIPDYTDDEIPGIVARMDVGVMPLDEDDWCRGKCAMKALWCMGGGKPVVSSPVGEIAHIVRDGDNGLLAHTPGEWAEKLTILIRDPEKSAGIAARGRDTVEGSFSDRACFDLLMGSVFSKVQPRRKISAE